MYDETYRLGPDADYYHDYGEYYPEYSDRAYLEEEEVSRSLTDDEAQEMLNNGSLKCYGPDGTYDEAATIEAILTTVKVVGDNNLRVRIISVGGE